jgi:hypothetical protein
VILLGGADGTGKTTVAGNLGATRVIHVDDIRLNEPFAPFRTPAVWDREPAAVLDLLRGATATMHRELVRIARHCAGSNTVIEGEGVEPAWATLTGAAACYLIDTDPWSVRNVCASRRTARAFLALSPPRRDTVVETLVLYSAWLRDEAVAHGQPWVAAQPWATLPERVLDAIGIQSVAR